MLVLQRRHREEICAGSTADDRSEMTLTADNPRSAKNAGNISAASGSIACTAAITAASTGELELDSCEL